MIEKNARRILVIDDEITHRILAKEYLEEAGYIVRLAEDGKRGLKMATTTRPDLVLVDLLIPAMDGLALCKAIRNCDATADVPVILITASREPDVIARGFAAGVDDFVTKPVDWAFIADRVGLVLAISDEKRRALAERKAMAWQLQAAQEQGDRHHAAPAHMAPRSDVIDDEPGAPSNEDIEERIRAVRQSAEAELQGLEMRYAAQMEAQYAEAQATIADLRAAAGRELEEAHEHHAVQMEACRAECDATIHSVREAARLEIEEERRQQTEAIEQGQQKTELAVREALADAKHRHDTVCRQYAARLEALRAEADERMRVLEAAGCEQLRAAQVAHARQVEAMRTEGAAQLEHAKTAVEAERQAMSAQHETQLQQLAWKADQQSEAFNREKEELRAVLESECGAKIRSSWDIARASSTTHVSMVKTMLEKLRAVTEESGSGMAPAHFKGRLLEVETLGNGLSASLGCLRLLAHMMSGKTTLDETVFDLPSLVQDTAAKMKALADMGKVAIRTSVPDHKLRVLADESRIAYGILSLTMNAIRHSPHGSSVFISVADAGQGGVQIKIEDQGVGMAEGQLEALRHCLDQPARLVGDGRVGFGIPISTALVRLHGGWLELDSNLGRGTTVAMCLPGSRRGPDALAEPNSPQQMPRAS